MKKNILKLTIFILLFFLILIGCQNRKEKTKKSAEKNETTFEYIYEKDYEDYYFDKLNYEFNNNAKPKNADTVFALMMADSINLIDLKRINLPHPDFTEKSNLNIHELIIGSEKSYFFYKHWEQIVNNHFHNFLIQIEYPLEKYARKKVVLFILKDEYDQRIHKSAYISWSSLQSNILILHPKKGLNLIFKNQGYYYPVYMWGINKTTDTIETNLSINSIKSLYPEFQGKYIFKKYSEIIVNYKYSTLDTSFFNNIQFIDQN